MKFKKSLFITFKQINNLDILNPPHVLPAHALISIRHKSKILTDVGYMLISPIEYPVLVTIELTWNVLKRIASLKLLNKSNVLSVINIIESITINI